MRDAFRDERGEPGQFAHQFWPDTEQNARRAEFPHRKMGACGLPSPEQDSRLLRQRHRNESSELRRQNPEAELRQYLFVRKRWVPRQPVELAILRLRALRLRDQQHRVLRSQPELGGRRQQYALRFPGSRMVQGQPAYINVVLQ